MIMIYESETNGEFRIWRWINSSIVPFLQGMYATVSIRHSAEKPSWQKLGIRFHDKKARCKAERGKERQRGSGRVRVRHWSSSIPIKYATFVSHQMIQTHELAWLAMLAALLTRVTKKSFLLQTWARSFWTWRGERVKMSAFKSLFWKAFFSSPGLWNKDGRHEMSVRGMPTFQTHWHTATLSIIRRKNRHVKRSKSQKTMSIPFPLWNSRPYKFLSSIPTLRSRFT